MMASGIARAASPVGPTWFEVDHAFGDDDCIIDSEATCGAASGTKYDCVMGRIAEGGRGAYATIIKNRSDASNTDICDGYDFCAFGAVKTSSTEETFFYCPFDGDDHVHGSRHVSASYKDWMYGGDDGDTIWGHDGNDTVQGGSGVDNIHGGDDNDVLYGHEGNDAICGGDGNDTLDGGANNDKLFGGLGTDTEDGGPGTDLCTSGGGGSNCTTSLTADPGECPPEHES